MTIKAYVGPNGAGKTLCAVEFEVMPALDAGRQVLTNLHLKPKVWGFREDQVELLVTLDQLLSPRPGTVVLLDEISTVFPSRAWSSMPGQIHSALQQLRKRGLDLIWTAPSWTRADVTLREVTLEVSLCSAVWKKKRTFPIWGQKMAWPRARMVLVNTWYDPSEYVQGQTKGGGYLPNKGQHLVRTLGTRAHLMYDTLEPVQTLEVHLMGEGVCLRCNGRKSRPSCQCKDALVVEDSACHGSHFAA